MLYPRRSPCRLISAAGLLTFLLAAPATAQKVEPESTSEVSPEDFKRITDSLRADTAVSHSATAPPPPPGHPDGAVAALLQSMNPDLAVILDVALAAFSDPDPLQLGGHDPQQAGFNLQQLEMHLEASVDPFLHFDANLVYTPAGVEIEEAYATTLALPVNLQMRAGQFLTRFGRMNPTHPHTWHFVDQPLVLGKFFGGDGNRALGAEVSWLSFLPWYLELVVSANQAGGGCCGRSYFNTDPPAFRRPSDALWTGAIKQFFALSDDWSVLWGVSGQTAPNAENGRTALYGTDLYVRYRPVASPQRTAISLQMEAILRDRHAPAERRLRDAGGYAELIWNIDPSWEVGGRTELVTGVADDPLDPSWNSRRTRYAAQATFYPTHFSRLRLQGSMDRPTWRTQPIYAAFLALEVVVGAHGAHNY